MLGSTQVSNPVLLKMMRANEQAQRSKMQRQAMGPLLAPKPRPAPPAAPASSSSGPKEQLAAARETAPSEEMRTETVPLTADEAEWLAAAALRQGHPNVSSVLQKLLQWSNGEQPAAKKKIFLVIRCRRCSAGAKGGVKHDHQIELPVKQWQWLDNVRERCKHASVAKTIRIIVDFYMPLCQGDAALEHKVIRRGCEPKAERHADAIATVDPHRAPRGPRPGVSDGARASAQVADVEAAGKPGVRWASHRAASEADTCRASTVDEFTGCSTADTFQESDSDGTQGGCPEGSARDACESGSETSQ